MTPTPITLSLSVLAVLAVLICKATKAVIRHGAWFPQSLLAVVEALLEAALRALHQQVAQAAAVLARLLIWLARLAHRGKVLLVAVHRAKRSITLLAAVVEQEPLA